MLVELKPLWLEFSFIQRDIFVHLPFGRFALQESAIFGKFKITFALGIHLGLVSLVIQGAEDQDVEGAANVFSTKVLDHWSVGADAFEAIALSSQGLVI